MFCPRERRENAEEILVGPYGIRTRDTFGRERA